MVAGDNGAGNVARLDRPFAKRIAAAGGNGPAPFQGNRKAGQVAHAFKFRCQCLRKPGALVVAQRALRLRNRIQLLQDAVHGPAQLVVLCCALRQPSGYLRFGGRLGPVLPRLELAGDQVRAYAGGRAVERAHHSPELAAARGRLYQRPDG
jgi:hypothetical protein